MKLFILANPAAGGGRSKRACEAVHEALEQQTIAHEFFLTQAGGQERQLLERILPAMTATDRLVIIGGDGTLSLTLDALPADLPFGFITAGSGNDFARGAGLSRDPLEALQAIIKGQAQDFYVLHYEATPFTGVAVNNIGIGLDAAIVKAANESKLKPVLNKVKLGQASYVITMLHVLFQKKSFQAKLLSADGPQTFEQAFLLTITKHPYFGGGVKIAPQASSFTDEIHIVEIDNIPKHHFPSILRKISAGTHFADQAVHHSVLSKLELTVIPSQPVQIDGETYTLPAGSPLLLRTEKRMIIK